MKQQSSTSGKKLTRDLTGVSNRTPEMDALDRYCEQMSNVGFKQEALVKDSVPTDQNRAIKLLGVRPLSVPKIKSWFEEDWAAERDIQRLIRQHKQGRRNSGKECYEYNFSTPIGLALDDLRQDDDNSRLDLYAYCRLNVVYSYSRYSELDSHGIDVYCIHKGKLELVSSGFSRGYPDRPNEATIYSVKTRPIWRGLNIAKVVMFGIERACYLTGFESLVLNAITDGKKLYETIGYEMVDSSATDGGPMWKAIRG